MKTEIKPLLTANPFTFDGYLAEKTDTLAYQRIRSHMAKKEIYPETEEAHRARVDDRLYPGRGIWQGEFWGKWVLSAVEASLYYQDKGLMDFLLQGAREIIKTQDADGYIGTYHDPHYYSRGTWSIWSRKYTLWGLVRLGEVTGDGAIFKAALAMASHLFGQFGPGKDSLAETGQFAGLPSTSILTPMVKLYRLTGEEKVLDFCRYIVCQWDHDPQGPPRIVEMGLKNIPLHQWFPNPQDWAKSYEFLSCVEGMLDLYEVIGNKDLLRAAVNIHTQLCKWERSPAGSVSYNDKFVGSAYLKNTVAEICDAVYWNRVSLKLLCLTGDARYGDEMERTLYNSLITGMSVDGTWGLRRLRLSGEHIPSHLHCQLKHHQCCVTNLPRGFFQAAKTTLLSDSTGFRVVLFSAGQGTATLPSGKKVRVTIEGEYPLDDRQIIRLDLEEPEDFTLTLRQPDWAVEMVVEVDGAKTKSSPAKGWIKINRTWNKGDSLRVIWGNRVHIERFDATVYKDKKDLIDWADGDWPKMGVMNEGEGEVHLKQITHLTKKHLRPHRDANAFFYGPLLLSRDKRLKDGDIYEPLGEIKNDQIPQGTPIIPPRGIRYAFEFPFANGRSIKFCDFASVGNTWTMESEFNTWIDE